ncbi:MAG: acetyltransferase [Bacteroidales bacterium]|nr:acetyltransferase [Bacteroidales bacterium]
MIIVGAGGHALEVYNEVINILNNEEEILFYDDQNISENEILGRKIIHNIKDIKTPQSFIIATGQPKVRKKLFYLFTDHNHIPVSLIAQSSIISSLGVYLGEAINIMAQVYVGPFTYVGRGTLINAKANIHHGSKIGEFCEIAPGAIISGNCKIGNEVFIGAGAIVLPNLTIEEGAIIGAGSVVTKNIPAHSIVKGVPAR